MTTIDFAKALRDAKSASYDALPAGDYDVEVATAAAVRASSGKPMIKVTCKVLFGPHQGRQVFNNFVLSLDNPMAMSIFFRHMRAFGLGEDFFAQLGVGGTLEPVAAALVGRRARFTLGIRQWQGEDRNEVNAVKPYTGSPATAGPGAAPLPPAAPPAPPVAPPPPAPVAQPPAPVTPAAQAPAGQYPPLAATQPVADPQPTFSSQVAQRLQEPTPPSPPPAATPVIEAAPFDGTAVPVAVPTAGPADGGYGAASSPQPIPPTSDTQYASPAPPAAPELPI